MKMPLGVKVGLGPGHIVVDRDPAPLPEKGAQPPIFGPCLLWPNGWMDQDATWYHGGRPRPRPQCARWGPSFPPKQPPIFWPISVMAKWMDKSRCHLVQRQASAQATLYYMWIQLPQKGHSPPIFGPCLWWPNGRPSQLLLSTCLYLISAALMVLLLGILLQTNSNTGNVNNPVRCHI